MVNLGMPGALRTDSRLRYIAGADKSGYLVAP